MLLSVTTASVPHLCTGFVAEKQISKTARHFAYTKASLNIQFTIFGAARSPQTSDLISYIWIIIEHVAKLGDDRPSNLRN